jgi:hypothetical protein
MVGCNWLRCVQQLYVCVFVCCRAVYTCCESVLRGCTSAEAWSCECVELKEEASARCVCVWIVQGSIRTLCARSAGAQCTHNTATPERHNSGAEESCRR